jgi:hypothetical protein
MKEIKQSTTDDNIYLDRITQQKLKNYPYVKYRPERKGISTRKGQYDRCNKTK